MECVTEDIHEALAYFSNEVSQINIILAGILRIEYREFLQNKSKYYQLAIKALKEKYNI